MFFRGFLCVVAVFLQLCLLINKPGCHCVSVKVTETKELEVGSSTYLDCNWTLEGNEVIYSVKWYQAFKEIYRYTPSRFPNHTQVFPNENLDVDITSSERGRIYISNVTLGASGLFRCEVSEEGPSFYTVYGTLNVTVVAPPKGNPVIIGLQEVYKIGDMVELLCSTSEAKPPPMLTFYVNEQKAPDYWLESQSNLETSDGFYESHLKLYFVIKSEFLTPSGTIRVRCQAQTLSVYEASNDVTVKTTFFNQIIESRSMDVFVNDYLLLMEIFGILTVTKLLQ